MLKDVLFKGFSPEKKTSETLEVDFPTLGSLSVIVNKTTKRKSLAIHVKEGQLEVRAPHHISNAQIISFLNAKSSWIVKKIGRQNQRPKFTPKKFVTGDEFYLLGNKYTLVVKEGGDKSEEVSGSELIIWLGNRSPLREPKIRTERQLKKWFVDYAETHICKQVDNYSEIMGERVNSIKVRNFKSQWGSCSQDADLKFNWRLIMAPPEVIDYVVVHELAHIKHHNHSKKYWTHVEQFMPDYKVHKKWLNENGALLRWD